MCQELGLGTASTALSFPQAIPLQSGLQVVVKVLGGLGLDISANVDVNIWEQELRTSIKTRSAGGKLLGWGGIRDPRGGQHPKQGLPHLGLPPAGSSHALDKGWWTHRVFNSMAGLEMEVFEELSSAQGLCSVTRLACSPPAGEISPSISRQNLMPLSSKPP